MSDLIKALQIFLKYSDCKKPIQCEHDALCVIDPMPSEVSPEDIKELDSLGFNVNKELGCFISFRFGSA